MKNFLSKEIFKMIELPQKLLYSTLSAQDYQLSQWITNMETFHVQGDCNFSVWSFQCFFFLDILKNRTTNFLK